MHFKLSFHAFNRVTSNMTKREELCDDINTVIFGQKWQTEPYNYT